MGPSERSRSSRSSSWTADGELVAGVRRGDEESFERLVGRYRAPVVAYVRGRVADRDLSEDIAQEIFIAALRSMRASQRPIVFKAWIYEIARNACIDQHRRRRRRPETAGLHDGLVDLSPANDPPAALELRQRVAALCLAFGELPPLERRLLAERELGGRPYAELASTTGLSVPAVESALHRGRGRLRVHYRLLTGERPAPPVAAAVGVPAAPGTVRLWDTA